MFKDLVSARIKALNSKNIIQMVLASSITILMLTLNKAFLLYVVPNAIDRLHGALGLLVVIIGHVIQIGYPVVARLIAMLNIDYDKVVTPLDVIRSRAVIQTIKISAILYIIYIGELYFISLLKPELTNNPITFGVASYIMKVLLIKFAFAVHLMLEYNKLGFISALGRSWEILKGKKLISLILLMISIAPITLIEITLQNKLTGIIDENIFLGIGVVYLIYLIKTYTIYLLTVYYYNLSKVETNEFGTYR